MQASRLQCPRSVYAGSNLFHMPQALMMTREHLIIALIDKRALGINHVWVPEHMDKATADAANDSGYAGDLLL